MASSKPTTILKSKTDMSNSEIENLSDEEAWRIIYSFRKNKVSDDRLEICLTGFGDSKKKELAAIASEKKLKVVNSVTKGLEFLCIGNNAGTKKIESAKNQGVQILTEEDFFKFIKTGEVPD